MDHICQDMEHFLNAILYADAPDLQLIMSGMMTHDCVFDVSAPFGRLMGQDDIQINYVWPLNSAFEDLSRNSQILECGIDAATGVTICAVCSEYNGTFSGSFAGLPPTGQSVRLSASEIFILDEVGRISHGCIIFDLVDLMSQCGYLPARLLGYEESVSRSLIDTGFAEISAGSDRKSFDRNSDGLCCGIVANDISIQCGWPAISVPHRNPFWGAPPMQKALDVRAIDFLRPNASEGPKRFTFIDYPDLFEQMNVDLIKECRTEGMKDQ